MNDTDIPYETYIEDVQSLIDQENPVKHRKRVGFDFKSYHKLKDIYSWLNSLAKAYPERVEVVVGGKTFEGRPIKGVKLSFKEGNPTVFIEGGIHAREWISAATVTYLIDQLLTSKDPQVRQLADSHDWYLFPSFNPDGYEYTHTRVL